MFCFFCENVQTESILSSCYGVHQGASRWDTGSVGWCVWIRKERERERELCTHTHTHTRTHAVDRRPPGNVHTPAPSFPSDAERRQESLLRSVHREQCSAAHNDRISNSSSSESKKRSSRSESEKSGVRLMASTLTRCDG